MPLRGSSIPSHFSQIRLPSSNPRPDCDLVDLMEDFWREINILTETLSFHSRTKIWRTSLRTIVNFHRLMSRFQIRAQFVFPFPAFWLCWLVRILEANSTGVKGEYWGLVSEDADELEQFYHHKTIFCGEFHASKFLFSSLWFCLPVVANSIREKKLLNSVNLYVWILSESPFNERRFFGISLAPFIFIFRIFQKRHDQSMLQRVADWMKGLKFAIGGTSTSRSISKAWALQPS